MKNLIGRLALVSAVASTLGGCVLYSHPAHERTVVRGEPVRERECRPGQHREGDRCVHNGRGHGARKHDD